MKTKTKTKFSRNNPFANWTPPYDEDFLAEVLDMASKADDAAGTIESISWVDGFDTVYDPDDENNPARWDMSAIEENMTDAEYDFREAAQEMEDAMSSIYELTYAVTEAADRLSLAQVAVAKEYERQALLWEKRNKPKPKKKQPAKKKPTKKKK